MAHNNDALYDAVVAGAGGGAQNGWLVLSTPASYTPFATNIDILATAVDLQIPTIAGGPSISQVNLLQSITQSVLTARYPVPSVPATYVDIAKAIAAVYTELAKLLTNQPAVASYGVNWLVANWYIDGVTGNDANSGVVIGAPLKTGAELLRRLGPYAMWPQSVTVNVLANGMTDALVLRGLMMVAGNHLDVIGTPTQVADAGTIATYAAVNHATPTATQITSTLIADWTAHQWRRLRVTGGARAGAISWVAKASPAGVGVATARISPPIKIETASATLNVLASTWVVGDPIVIESLPVVPELSIYLDGPIDTNAGAVYIKRQFSIQDLDAKVLSVYATGLPNRAKTLIFGGRFQTTNFMMTPNPIVNLAQFSGCLFYLNDSATSGSTNLGGPSYVSCLFGNGISTVTVLTFSGFTNCLFQETRFVSNASGAPIQVFNCQSFDNPSALSTVNVTAGAISSWSGSGNAGVGFVCVNGSVIALRGTMNVKGATTDCQLGSAPTINLTWPQFQQPNDWAQKGTTVAMVAGSVTVTVPWYDNVVQKVTACHAAPAGTLGILSVNQISNTQFVITSSNALDTSTVNWTISPLGRNIFISP